MKAEQVKDCDPIWILQISGVIFFDDDNRACLYLINGDDKINLTEWFESAVEQNGNKVQLSYWISDNPCKKEDMLESWLKKIHGAIETDCDEVYQGSWTYGGGSWASYDKNYSFKIGGHDLFQELSEQDGRFIILELNFNQQT